MKSFTVSPSHSVTALASSLIFIVRLSRVLAGSGRSIDLSGLDDRVGLLRARILDLDPEDATEIKLHVFQLASEIDSFCAAHTGTIPEVPLMRIRATIAAILETSPLGNPT